MDRARAWRLLVPKVAALAIVLALYGLSRPIGVSATERAALARRFRFESHPLPELDGPRRAIRRVHPSLEHLSAWMSALGAAIALADIDGDGRPNDLCLIDPRFDQAIVAPVPGTGRRYRQFTLPFQAVAFEASTMAPTGCQVGDWNEDGRADLLVAFWGRTPILFLRRATAGVPTAAAFRAVELAARPALWNTAAVTQADLDGDGHLDLVVGNYFQDGARLLDVQATGREEMQDGMARASNGGRKHFFLGGGGTEGLEPMVEFREVDAGLEPEVATGWTLAVGAADLDGDARPELYLANDFGPDRLLHNRSSPGRLRFAKVEGKRTFFTPPSEVLGRDSFKGMGVDFGDLNGDGLLDLYVSNIANDYALQESHFVWESTGEVGRMRDGVAPYVDRGEDRGLSRSAWAWDARLADFDTDGVLEAVQATGFVRGTVNRWPELQEIAMGNDQLLKQPGAWAGFRAGTDLSGHVHDPFFVRAANGRYVDLARDVGFDATAVGRGLATADVDGDGRLDLAVANQWDRSWLYMNRAPEPGSFLGLRLLLPLRGDEARSRFVPGRPGGVRGRPAIGAIARVRLPDRRLLVGLADGGNGHAGDRSPEIFLGLGRVERDRPLAIEITWRDGHGAVRRESFPLAPGWHTILLGEGAQG